MNRPFLKGLVLVVLGCALLACADRKLSLRPQGDPDQPALDTTPRTEPERTWDGVVTARDIRWSYNLATPLRASVSVVGSFRITLVNTDPLRPYDAGLLLRFVAPDGERHVAEIPVARVAIPADSLIHLRDNFIIEVKDHEAANAIVRMDISLF